MVLFNWHKILKAAKYKQKKALRIFYRLTHDIPVTSLRDPMFPLLWEKDYSGKSFLLRPKPIYSGKYSDLERIQYIALAALRSYPEYLISGVTTLNLDFSLLDKEQIDKNQLLSLNNNQICFKYEE